MLWVFHRPRIAGEHSERYGLPDDGADVIVYTGFGYKGRNVINVRSADVVIIFGGATGTLNEFTIAYDEGQDSGRTRGKRRGSRPHPRDHPILQEDNGRAWLSSTKTQRS